MLLLFLWYISLFILAHDYWRIEYWHYNIHFAFIYASMEGFLQQKIFYRDVYDEWQIWRDQLTDLMGSIYRVPASLRNFRHIVIEFSNCAITPWPVIYYDVLWHIMHGMQILIYFYSTYSRCTYTYRYNVWIFNASLYCTYTRI